jgi:transcriptional regulator with XRE-family HTH domain
MALPQSQAMLHCTTKVVLYTVEMTLGNRIKAARERLKPKMTQGDLGGHFDVTDKAVSGWERDIDRPDLDKIARLARVLKVPSAWLLEGTTPPPSPDSLEVAIEDLLPGERAVVDATIQALRRQRDSVA